MLQNTAANTATKKRPVSRKEMSKFQWTLNEMKKNYIAYIMLAPFFLLFCIFTAFPVLLSIFMSFTDFNVLQTPNFVGVDNYLTLFLDDEIFLLAVKNTLMFAAITGPVSYLLSLLLAWFINELPPKVRAVVTFIYYSPSISGMVYMVWQFLFSADSHGFVNGWLLELGITTVGGNAVPVQWFQNADFVMPLCIVVALWTSIGTAFLSFIAGLQTVSKSLYEAAAVDGIRNRWQELWHITLPVMKPQLMFGAVTSITSAFSFGTIVTALAGFPSVEYAAHTIMHHLEDYGGVRFEVGYSSAIATILFLLMIGSNKLIKNLIGKVGQS
ncbi:MAG: sugar ABC transporter permease [Clostridia bacterium]|nr:sugar ABC transporter permease [Clostridia bacterium]